MQPHSQGSLLLVSPSVVSNQGGLVRAIYLTWRLMVENFIGLDPIIRHLHISHDAPYLPPQILHKHCFQFLLGRL